MDNQRGPVEEHGRDLVGVRSELLTSEQAVEDQTRVGQTAGLDCERGNCAAVCGVGSTQPREGGVVVGTISGTVLVLITHVTAVVLAELNFMATALLRNQRGQFFLRERRVGNGVPQLIQELVSELNTVLRVTGHIGNKLESKHTLIFSISNQLSIPIGCSIART